MASKPRPSYREFWLALLGALLGIWLYELQKEGGWQGIWRGIWPGILFFAGGVALVLYAYRKG